MYYIDNIYEELLQKSLLAIAFDDDETLDVKEFALKELNKIDETSLSDLQTKGFNEAMEFVNLHITEESTRNDLLNYKIIDMEEEIKELSK